ncbi:MAG TPA: hypothetical protein VL003_03350 [Pusillimonas sp.]|uniref:hypothetical protein n=1 Tax=Pusillimonas sp. TaxID=3040095 RepID=UPI002C9C7336|nr:hypothetical protein [Pusillimonas sp.]HUH87069.1 hypothetical protein [Pusillimonas sp.]
MVSDIEGISPNDIRKYLQRICQEAEGLMRDYDPRALVEWTDTNIADGACFQVDVRIEKDGSHTGSIAMTLTKEDLLQMGGVFGAAVNKENIVDYSLDLALRDVITHGTEAATAKVTWREHLIVQGQPGPDEERSRLTLEAEADCVHLVVREEGRLTLGLSLCSGTARLGVSG